MAALSAAELVPRFVKSVTTRELLKIAHKQPNLKTVSSIKILFCPWEKNTQSIKEFWRKVNTVDTLTSNRKCTVKTETKHDGSKPEIHIIFNDGEKLKMRSEHLKIDELTYHLTAFCHHKELALEEQTTALF